MNKDFESFDGFDSSEYYDDEYISEYEDVDPSANDEFAFHNEKQTYDDAENDFKELRDIDDNDFSEEDDDSEDEYAAFKAATSKSQKKSKGTKTKVSMKGADVQQRFYKIMEDYHSGDPRRQQYALECAIEELKGFIYYTIKKTYPTYIKDNFYDLVQEGKLGIIVGMQKYDPDKGMPTTFFSPYIKHEMQNLITRQVDKTTAHYSTKIKEINKAIEHFEACEIPYTNVDLAIQTGLPLETVNQSMSIRAYRNEVHIDGCLPGVIDANQTSSRLPTPEEEFMEKEEKNILYTAINENLTPEEIQVLEYHFGINDVETISEAQIAKKMRIPKDKVKKLINSSIRKLKNSELKNLYRNHLAKEDDLIEDTDIAFVPAVTIDEQLDILGSLSFSDDEEEDNENG